MTALENVAVAQILVKKPGWEACAERAVVLLKLLALLSDYLRHHSGEEQQ
jgi:hypothetical protein